MDLRSISNAVSDTVNQNISVTVFGSAGYIIGSGLKQVPLYADPITGFAQVQALTQADIRHTDGLNIQGELASIILRGPLSGIVRANGQGGDLVIVAGNVANPFQGTWLVNSVLETWPLWTRALIVRQEAQWSQGSGTPYTGWAYNVTPTADGASCVLPYAPNPCQSLQLFVEAVGFGWIMLSQGEEYRMSGSTITFINGNSYAASALRAWYRY